MTELLLNALVLSAAMMSALWVVSLLIRNAGIADAAWGPFTFLVTIFYMWENRPWDPYFLVIVGAVGLWGIRLGLHILLRNAGKGEDYRYAQWRAQHGSRWALRSLFQVFFLQGLILWILTWPLGRAAVSQGEVLQPLWAAGIVVFLFGFFWESIADLQLLRFKKKPENKGKLMTSGLWRYSRHPNYFGEAVVWWGLTAASLSFGAWHAGSLWVLVSPIMMTFLLLKVSGVTMLEEGLAKTKPDFAAYAASTNAFIPGPPRSRNGKPVG